MKNIIKILILMSSLFIMAQKPSAYARKVVDVLASDDFAGRGYTHNGLQKAQDEIVSQFEKIGLKPFNNSYLQTVTYPINVIDHSTLSINGKTMDYGRDYIISGASFTEKGSANPVYFDTSVIDSLFLNRETDDLFDEIDRLKGKAIVFPEVDFPPNYIYDGVSANEIYKEIKMNYQNDEYKSNNKVLIELVPVKLTAGLSAKPKSTQFFMIKDSALSGPIKEMNYDIQTHFEPNFVTHNVIGYIPGKDTSKKILITAHYDHLGQVGDAVFTGANDNASGVAMMLSLAKYYSVHQPNYTMVFIAFTGEEAGLQGSTYFVEHPPFDLKDIRLVCNFDIVGTGDEGIQVVNSTKYPKIFQSLEFINEKHSLLTEVRKRGEACNSDHCPFDQKGVPAIFTYTLGGYPYYHDTDDRAENLTLKKFDDVFFLFTTYFNDYMDQEKGDLAW